MSDLMYTPQDPLEPVAVGDFVQVMSRNMDILSTERVVHVGKRHVRTACGRRWTITEGEFIGLIRGSRIVSYPFPSIRKAP